MDTQKDKSPETNPFRMLKQKQQSTTNDSNTQSQNAPPTLAQLEKEIKFHLKQASQSIIEVGKRLTQAKSLIKHGEWQTWLENNFQLSQNTAGRFMQVAKRFSNSATSQNLNQSQMIALLSLPSAEETKKFIEQKDTEGTPVSNMSVKTLNKEIKKWKTEKTATTKDKTVDEQTDTQKQPPTDTKKPLQPDSQPTTASSTDSESLEQDPLTEEQSDADGQEQVQQTTIQADNTPFDFDNMNPEINITPTVTSVPNPLDNLFRVINELATVPDLKQKIYEYSNTYSETFYSDIDNLFKVVNTIREFDNRK